MLMQPSIYFFNGICRASSTSTPYTKAAISVSYTHLDVYKRQAADKAHGQTAYDSEDISGGMGLLTPEGPAVDAEEEAFIRAMKRKKKKKRKGLGM